MHEQNPWWKDGRISEDPDFRRWSESGVKWIPDFLDQLPLQPYSLSFIFGPRQVGKTTSLKLLIERLLRSGVNPKAIFYYRCDKLSDYKELDELLEKYLGLKKAEGVESSYILLDEITFPKEWYRSIKYRIDSGHFSNDVLVLTGSWSMYVKREVETFPGRRGHGKDIIVHPLSFRDFLKVLNPQIYHKIPQLDPELKRIKETCFKTLPWVDELNEAFQKYLECGGFPLSVKSMLTEGKISVEAKEAILSSFLSDLAKLRRSEGLAKRIMKAVIEKLPSPLSLNSVAREFEVGSHKTVFYFLELFEKMFLAKNVYFVDPNKMLEVYRKERKVHLTDPLYYRVFSEWCLTEMPSENALVESVVTTHLSRRFRVGYWRNRTEIDVVLQEIGLGLEIKWGEKAEVARRKIGKIKETITLTRKEFREEPLAVPVSVFLACLEV
jgi:predicted AAA+ superfamily ATPase